MAGKRTATPRAVRRPPARPRIIVLAGVNGAGKSSVGGAALQALNLSWFNPDTYSREIQRDLELSLEEANAQAWEYGRELLQQAIGQGTHHAFETTLGGNTIARMLEQATQSHDVHVWYCGLDSVELHLQRVAERVAAGGHDIDPARIARRHVDSPHNLLRLMPRLAGLSAYDNSAGADPDGVIPDPVLVLKMTGGCVTFPLTAEDLAATPAWARPLVERALEIQESAAGPAA